MTTAFRPRPNTSPINNRQHLHYYKGKLKALSGNDVYFIDQRNVAVVDTQNLYINGQQATDEDLEHFHSVLPKHSWNEKIEIHSYVSECSSYNQHHVTLQFLGKKSWRAKLAWVGNLPAIINNISSNILYMPVSYYTGQVKRIFEDRVLFGDARNSVMVSGENFYMRGERASANDIQNVMASTDSVIHAYITRLHILTHPGLRGPEPYLPTWPKGTYTSDLWVAKFAWQGPMPVQVKEQAERHYIIRLNEWNFSGCSPWKIGNFRPNNQNDQKDDRKEGNLNNHNYERTSILEPDGKLPLVPMEQEPGIMRGSILIADHEQALMTSFADVIAFEKENFYINGEKFRSQQSLSHFLQDRRVYLTAWVQPMKQLKCIFHINVAWYASCVWLGNIPVDLNTLQYQSMNGQEIGRGLVETLPSSSALRLTHYMGGLINLSHTYGVFRSRVNLKQMANVAFKRKVVYMHGSKLPSSISLLDKSDIFESNTWSMLAYPVTTDVYTGIRQYRAIAVWQYQYQNYMGMIPAIISEAVDCNGFSQNYPVSSVMDEGFFQTSGWIVWICAEFGIIKSKDQEKEPVFMYFKKSLLYIDGELWNDSFSLHEISAHQQCKVLAKQVPKRDVFGYSISSEATLVWFGVKPSKVNHDTTDVSTLENSSKVQNTTKVKENITSIKVEPSNLLHAVHGVILGMVLMTDFDQGLIVSSRNIVAFSSKHFYVNGVKFKNKHESLSDYCSGRQVNVRALVIPQQEAKVVLGCKVICEAICVWIGVEPNNLKNLEISYNKQLLEKNSDNMENLPLTSGFFYMLGNITKVSDTMGILSCSTPDGYVKAAFWSTSIFINGALLSTDEKLTDEKSYALSDWSCFVYPVTPKEYFGQIIRFSAIAVWQSIDYHKIEDQVFKLVTSETHKLHKDNVDESLSPITLEKYLSRMKINNQEVCQSSPKNNMERTLNQRIALPQMTRETQGVVRKLEGSNQQIEKSNPGKESHNGQEVLEEGVIHKNNNKEKYESTQEFCGKHMTGYVIKRYQEGGIAQWKSHQLMGYIHIEFSCKTMYVDLKPLSKKFKVAALQTRSCNFFVKPIPHHTVCGHTVSLQATCGWIGKKPPNLPRPGTQELANLSFSDVHVTPLDVPPETDKPLPDDSEEVGELPLIPTQDKIITPHSYLNGYPKINQDPQPVIKQLSPPRQQQSEFPAHPSIQQLMSTVHTPPPDQIVPPPLPPSTTESNIDGIWAYRSKKDGHQRGTVTGVFASVGQLEGEDGNQYYFPRDSCYLYGVTLRNVELWHVLVQGDKVLYTTFESKPGSSKVDGVWLGAVKIAEERRAAVLISEWCKKNLVPDGAREILIHQLEIP